MLHPGDPLSRLPLALRAVPVGSGLASTIQNKLFDFNTSIPSIVLSLFLPAKSFTAILTHLDVPSFSLLCASTPCPSDPSASCPHTCQDALKALRERRMTRPPAKGEMCSDAS